MRTCAAIVAGVTYACTATAAIAFVLAPASSTLSSRSSAAGVACARIDSTHTVLSMSHDTQQSAGDRRAFLSNALQGAGVAVAGLGLAGFASAALADGGGELGDLSAGGSTTPMGSPVSEEDARIARKLAAQARITGKSSSGKMTVQESMSNEQEKQARIAAEKKDKERRRAVMCEELGRGC